MRAAGCYPAGADEVTHGAALRAGAAFCHRHQADGGEDPLLGVEELLDVRARGLHPVLVDLIEGPPLPDYMHPRESYIFGPEDGTLEPARFAAVKEVIYVPTQGCMNLGRLVNVIPRPVQDAQSDPLRPAGQDAQSQRLRAGQEGPDDGIRPDS